MSEETAIEENDAPNDGPANSERESQPIRVLDRDGVHYTLLGTAHVSRTSADVVAEKAASGEFDVIAVEICATRLKALSGKKDWKDLDIPDHSREKGWPGDGQSCAQRLPETHRRTV